MTSGAVNSIPAHDDHVNAVKWIGDSENLVVSGSDDGLIKLWDRRALDRGQPAGTFVVHLDGIASLDSTVCLEAPFARVASNFQ